MKMAAMATKRMVAGSGQDVATESKRSERWFMIYELS
jgi:hypothetical protein